MKTTNILRKSLILVSLFAFGCVEDPGSCDSEESSSSSSVSAVSDTNTKAACGDTSIEPDPTDITDPTDPTTSEPFPIPVPGDRNTGTTDSISLQAPWNNPNTTIVIDAYQGNSINWDKMAKDTRMTGVIHRSSIGLRVDTKYVSRRKIALERGYLWGAYHLGRPGNVIKQAKLFLSLIDDLDNTLMILDLEDTNSGKFMSIAESQVFMKYIFEETGKIPTVYANHSTTKSLNTKVKDDPIFAQSKLWYARFKSNVSDYPSGVWPNYFLWQFSSEINCSRTGSCLYNVPGTSSDMDINVFYGSHADLVTKWNND